MSVRHRCTCPVHVRHVFVVFYDDPALGTVKIPDMGTTWVWVLWYIFAGKVKMVTIFNREIQKFISSTDCSERFA